MKMHCLNVYMLIVDIMSGEYPRFLYWEISLFDPKPDLLSLYKLELTYLFLQNKLLFWIYVRLYLGTILREN